MLERFVVVATDRSKFLHATDYIYETRIRHFSLNATLAFLTFGQGAQIA